MKLLVLGSGGNTTIPRPGCDCNVCEEARAKGTPYSRSGCSMFIEDFDALFDTPEEIACQVNRHGIRKMDFVFYTHWHPDHTFGMRIVERMYKFWLDMFVRGNSPRKMVKICALEKVLEDLKSIGYRGSSFFQYYEKSGLLETKGLRNGETFKIKELSVTPYEVQATYNVSTVFLIEQKNKRCVYAPCDVKPFPKNLELRNLDLLIIGSFHPEGQLKEGIIIPRDNPLRKELFSPSEMKELARKLNAKKTLVTHIEEEWGKSYDEYKQLGEELNLEFAYDGMRIQL